MLPSELFAMGMNRARSSVKPVSNCSVFSRLTNQAHGAGGSEGACPIKEISGNGDVFASEDSHASGVFPSVYRYIGANNAHVLFGPVRTIASGIAGFPAGGVSMAKNSVERAPCVVGFNYTATTE